MTLTELIDDRWGHLLNDLETFSRNRSLPSCDHWHIPEFQKGWLQVAGPVDDGSDAPSGPCLFAATTPCVVAVNGESIWVHRDSQMKQQRAPIPEVSIAIAYDAWQLRECTTEGPVWFDLRSMHMATAGLSSRQLTALRHPVRRQQKWASLGAGSEWPDAWAFHCGADGEQVDRLPQNFSLEMLVVHVIRTALQSMRLFRVLWPKWDNAVPSRVSQAAHMLQSNMTLPADDDWHTRVWELDQRMDGELLTLDRDVRSWADEHGIHCSRHLLGSTSGLTVQWAGVCYFDQPVKKAGKRLRFQNVDGEWQLMPKRLQYDVFGPCADTSWEDGNLTTDHPKRVERVRRIVRDWSYWLQIRDRVDDRSVCGRRMIPHVTPCGTVTGRTAESLLNTIIRRPDERHGTELAGCVKADRGWHFISADVAEQELQIAQLVTTIPSDSCVSYEGIANELGISRDQAKLLLLQRLYGASWPTLYKLVKEVAPNVELAAVKAALGTPVINAIVGMLATRSRGDQPRLPMLRTLMPPALWSTNTSDWQTTRSNWVLQGTATEWLHAFIVAFTLDMIRQRLHARIVFTLHDEIIVHAPDNERQAVEEALDRIHDATWLRLATRLVVPSNVYVPAGGFQKKRYSATLLQDS